jgi:hypothetical protein
VGEPLSALEAVIAAYLWFDFMLDPESFDPESARGIATKFLHGMIEIPPSRQGGVQTGSRGQGAKARNG